MSPLHYYYVSLAFATNVIIILHVCWGVLFFDGFDQIKISGWPHLYIGLIKVFVVVASHMLISALVSEYIHVGLRYCETGLQLAIN